MDQATTSENQAVRLRSYRRNYIGWQYRPALTVVQDAQLLPQTVQTTDHELKSIFRHPLTIFNGGVYDAAGRIVEDALHQGMLGLRHLPDTAITAEPEHRLDGTWLYGGVLFRHIGHMLTESIGRLWGLQDTPLPIRGVVFIAMNGFPPPPDQTSAPDWIRQSADTTNRSGQFREMLALFGADMPVHLVGPSVRVAQLVVPSQLMGLLPYDGLIEGHPKYRDHIKAQVRSSIPDNAGDTRRIFVSRSRFHKPTSASIFGETALDHYFGEHGFEVMHPELLTLKEQLARYASASHIVLAAGSAAHVAALAMNGRQDVVLLRRFPGQNDQFGPQLLAMGARSVTTLDVLSSRFLPVDDEARRTFSEPLPAGIYGLDLDALWQRLSAMGFVDRPLEHSMRAELESQVPLVAAQLEQRYGRSFDLMPLA